jgi:hypothetical protein
MQISAIHQVQNEAKFVWCVKCIGHTNYEGAVNLKMQHISLVNLVVCILLRVLDQVQGFHLTQHCSNSFIYLSCFLFLVFYFCFYSNSVALDGNPEPNIILASVAAQAGRKCWRRRVHEKLKVSIIKIVTIAIKILQQISRRKFCDKRMIHTFLQWPLSDTTN